jgi:hypothetical protein
MFGLGPDALLARTFHIRRRRSQAEQRSEVTAQAVTVTV